MGQKELWKIRNQDFVSLNSQPTSVVHLHLHLPGRDFWTERGKALLDSMIGNLVYDSIKLIAVGTILLWIASKI